MLGSRGWRRARAMTDWLFILGTAAVCFIAWLIVDRDDRED
jgi:hypothetical protein